MKALVISAFPACGKSTFYQSHKDGKLKVLDSDSSLFSWKYDDEGNKTNERNPEFPQNYIQHIKDNMDTADIIFVSSHENVRRLLQSENIPYVLVFPKYTLRSEWIDRCIRRGSAPSFVNLVSDEWEVMLDSCASDDKAAIFQLQPESYADDNLSAINDSLIAFLMILWRDTKQFVTDMPDVSAEDHFQVIFHAMRTTKCGDTYSIYRFYPAEFSDEPLLNKLMRSQLAFCREYLNKHKSLPVLELALDIDKD